VPSNPRVANCSRATSSILALIRSGWRRRRTFGLAGASGVFIDSLGGADIWIVSTIFHSLTRPDSCLLRSERDRKRVATRARRRSTGMDRSITSNCPLHQLVHARIGGNVQVGCRSRTRPTAQLGSCFVQVLDVREYHGSPLIDEPLRGRESDAVSGAVTMATLFFSCMTRYPLMQKVEPQCSMSSVEALKPPLRPHSSADRSSLSRLHIRRRPSEKSSDRAHCRRLTASP